MRSGTASVRLGVWGGNIFSQTTEEDTIRQGNALSVLKELARSLVEQGYASSAKVDGYELYVQWSASSSGVYSISPATLKVTGLDGSPLPYSTKPGQSGVPYVDLSKVWIEGIKPAPEPAPMPTGQSVNVPSADKPLGAGDTGSPPWSKIGSWLPQGPPDDLLGYLKWFLLIAAAVGTVYVIDKVFD